ncbi:MAG: hypothetical protein Kow0080_04720 [Candidatus Promineifilaceae bacterium]
MLLHRIVSDIDDNLPDSPFVRPGGSLLLMVGLPGTGKSSVVEGVQNYFSCVVISSDNIRLQMRNQPTYTAAEMMLVYEVCYSLIEARLRRGQRVIFDATNYLAARRQRVMEVARRCGAPVAVCYVQASQDVIRQRMLMRASNRRRKTDLSDADWAVYQWMVEAQEPVMVEHLIVDTTNASVEELGEKVSAYWLDIEANAASDLNLQSSSWARQLNGSHSTGR